ncbi:hypothetical protein HDF24_23925 [Mucilaginibacter sp. X4EP1]|uniref:hypothetical protein n=1 Tax=Mucilaginibacter sp. X4EP1 TaxID=2723092 RepID=UPI0021676A48|nr:hypothetical protein [Mucilaginibacter sp. X4EP1]MCS3816140.1 hypothetical protein [Mucilaginibacter sp. X4EP1]
MKAKYRWVFIIGTLLSLYACTKGSNSGPGSIVGNWNIVSDSTYSGVGYLNHPVDYAGQPGDYFNITAKGIIYTKEGQQLDTLSYHLVADTDIVITSFGVIANGVPQVSSIKTLTSTSLVIASPLFLSPGGIFGRKITLSR